MDAHLGAGVDGQLRAELAAELRDTQILDDDRVDACADGDPQELGRGVHLPVGGEGVEGQVDLRAADMTEADGLAQLVRGEVFGVGAGIERAQPQIDRVGAALDGCAQRVHGPGGGEKFDHADTSPRPASRAHSNQSYYSTGRANGKPIPLKILQKPREWAENPRGKDGKQQNPRK